MQLKEAVGAPAIMSRAEKITRYLRKTLILKAVIVNKFRGIYVKIKSSTNLLLPFS